MKKLLLALVAGLALSLSAITPAMADTKIGVINLQDLLPKLPEMKQASDNLKNTFSDREKQIIAAQNDFKKSAADYQKNSAVMSQSDRQAAEQKLAQSEQNLQQMQASFQHDYMDAQSKAINKLMTDLKAVVQKVAIKDKYSVVLISASVAYSDPSLDITNEVLAAWQNK
jgi:outer membrane protein